VTMERARDAGYVVSGSSEQRGEERRGEEMLYPSCAKSPVAPGVFGV